MKFFIELNRKNALTFVIVYLSFLLDNVLLTVVVPIIPDYLFSNDLNITLSADTDTRLGPASLSPLQRKYETLENENGPLGALLASKAFVQLAFTPLIGYLIGRLGCNVPLLIGSCNMLLASIFFAYGNSYSFLVLARALHGSASAAVAVSGMCILAKNLPDDSRAKLMPLAFGGIGLGVLIGYPMGGAAYQTLGKTAPFIFIAILIYFNIVLQLAFLQEKEEYNHQSTIGRSYGECMGLLRDNKILLVTITICVCTSTMAILEPCVPIWLLGKMDPPPTKWQLGAIFIPDSIGYFIGSNFTGLLPVKPWRMAFCALVISGLSCCFLPLANTISQLSLPHFCIGLGVGIADAALVPMLATLSDRRGAEGDYGPIYALQQASVAVAYSLGPLLAGQAVHLIGFLWAMRIAGFTDLVICPFMVELNYEEDQEDKRIPLKSTTAPYYSST